MAKSTILIILLVLDVEKVLLEYLIKRTMVTFTVLHARSPDLKERRHQPNLVLNARSPLLEILLLCMDKKCILNIIAEKSVDVNSREETVMNMKENSTVLQTTTHFFVIFVLLVINLFLGALLLHLDMFGIQSTLYALFAMSHFLAATSTNMMVNLIANFTTRSNLESLVPNAIVQLSTMRAISWIKFITWNTLLVQDVTLHLRKVKLQNGKPSPCVPSVTENYLMT